MLVEPEHDSLPRREHRGAAVSAVLSTAAVGFLAWAALPLFGLESNRYAIALVALTQYAAVAGISLALLALLLRRWLTALVVGLVSAALAYSVVPRAIPDSARAAEGVPLRVLSLNAYVGQADAAQVVDLVRRNQVDVLSLQELTPQLVAALDAAGLAGLLPYRVFHAGPKADGSGIASRYPLRELSLVPPTTLAQPSALVDVPGARDVEFVAVHPLYPMGRGTADVWDRELAALPQPSLDGRRRVLAGDFNATLDHARLRELLDRGYTDAGASTGGGLSPTWPGQGAWFPPPVTIDHVLVGGGVSVNAYRVFDVAGTDHRAIFAHLTLTG
ncbi:endonuclease [Saccharopolyspora subtropica]|uniref:Endonuclease n=1 Tax=Saccharopolyspora thermophila TaxID=89367 RepID=A0A917JJU1_9PSEU|nr:endonuclease/exonuclease/phosphatase family protein [Saccharopolyspora subtropica]GGI67667.1 endonuclease [Saccharopolyspora subtropica]